MKTRIVRFLSLAAGLALPAPFAFAAEIAFDGGPDGSATDLAVAENWVGDALPSASDIATVNCATWPALALGGDLAVAGLKLSGATAAVTLEGAGTLTLGASGLTFNAKQVFNLKAPVAIAAEQTWTFAEGAIHSYSTLSGSAALTWKKGGHIHFHTAPNYGGAFTCTEGHGVRHYTAGSVATKFTSSTGNGDSAANYDYFLFPGVARFSELFTEGYFRMIGWRRMMISVPSTGTTVAPTIKIDRESDCWDGSGPYRIGLANGTLDHSAGTIKTLNYGIAVGAYEELSEAGVANANAKLWPCLWKMSGTANLTGSYIFIGERAAGGVTNYPCFLQQGGTATIGKCVAIGVGTNAGSETLAEYKMEGGSLQVGISNVGSDHQTRALTLCHPFGGASSQPGVYTQTGGETTVWGIKFGPDTGAWGGNPTQVNAGYGLFSLLGGSLTLAKGGSGIGFGKGWNASATANSHYRINLGGGTLVSQLSHTVPAGIFVAPGETPSTWNTLTNRVTINAPLSGDGTLRKTGPGRLTLTDAARFTGALRVDEGEVFVPGASSVVTPTTNENCWVWTADSLKDTYAHGQCVSNWVDRNHGLAATDWATAGTMAYKKGTYNGYAGAVPTLNTSVTLNGHATLRFAKSILAIPSAQNPLVDGTNFTIAVAFRPDNFNGNRMVWYGGTILGGGDYDYSCDVPIFNIWPGGQAFFGGVSYPDGYNRKELGVFSRSGRSIADTAHVAVMTVKGLEFALVTDGGVTNANFAKTWNYRKMFRQCGTCRGNAMPLYLGGHFPDEVNYANANAYIAELRIYKDRSFTVPEQQAIAKEILEKYRSDGAGEYLNERTGTYPGTLTGEPAQSDPAPCAYEWNAETLGTVAEGSEVTTWANTSNTVSATAAVGAGSCGPTFVTKVFNGHGALRFAAADKTALGIEKGKAKPVYGANLSFAVVFSSRDNSMRGPVHYGKDSGTGIFTTDLATSTSRAGLKFLPQGIVLPYVSWSWHYIVRPIRLNDGLPHVVVVTRDASNKRMTLNVDGFASAMTLTDTGTVTSLPLLIGRLATGYDGGFFTGEIADLRFYDRALTTDESQSLAEYLGWKYGFRLLAKGAYESRDLAQNGLGATNVTVAAGARLYLPTPETGGSLSFGAGETLDLAGEISGAVEFGNGATLKVDPAQGLARIERLTASGTVTLDVKGLSDRRPRWLPLVAVGSCDLSGVTWAFDDGGIETSVIVRNGVLGLLSRRGFTFILR